MFCAKSELDCLRHRGRKNPAASATRRCWIHGRCCCCCCCCRRRRRRRRRQRLGGDGAQPRLHDVVVVVGVVGRSPRACTISRHDSWTSRPDGGELGHFCARTGRSCCLWRRSPGGARVASPAEISDTSGRLARLTRTGEQTVRASGNHSTVDHVSRYVLFANHLSARFCYVTSSSSSVCLQFSSSTNWRRKRRRRFVWPRVSAPLYQSHASDLNRGAATRVSRCDLWTKH